MFGRHPRHLVTALATALVWHCVAASAGAQYVPPGGYPGYYPPGYYPPYPPGAGYWYGQAAVLDAYGNLGLDQEKARILREQANQAKLDTKKKTIDTMAYERANKYWWSDEQVDIQSKQIQAAMNNPPVQEITSGRALNTLLPFLDKLMATGARGPTVPIDPQIVRQLNVTTGAENGNVGLLKELNGLVWPDSLQGPTQKKLDEMLKQATYDAMKGPLPSTMVRELKKTTDALEEENRKKFHKSEIDGSEFIDGRRMLDRVRNATVALQQPTAGKLLSGALGPQGDTVDEIVQSMSSKGLMFARSEPGHENAYVAVHRAFVNFALATGTPDTGFRVRINGTAGMGPQAKQ